MEVAVKPATVEPLQATLFVRSLSEHLYTEHQNMGIIEKLSKIFTLLENFKPITFVNNIVREKFGP